MSIDKLERNNRRLDSAAQSAAHTDAAVRDDRGDAAASHRYAEELTLRFNAYVDWAIANWPLADSPPDQACFERSRQELAALCRKAGADMGEDPTVPGGAQFVPVTPMPWP